jgi:thiol-disulfide isomerase/thioredoxin
MNLVSPQATKSFPRGPAIWMAVLLFAAHSPAQPTPSKLSLGASAPGFSLPGIDGKVHKLADYDSAKVLAVAFLCNHCTTSQLYESRLQKLADDYRDKGFAFVAIQSDNPAAVATEDLAFTDVGDSLADMKERATYQHLTFPYLYDGETQATTKLYGATLAPQIFLFDQSRKLRYQGRIDDNVLQSQVKISYAKDSIDALLAGTPIAITSTTPTGCALHPNATSAATKLEKNKQEAELVNITLAGPEELKKLRANEAGRMLLVNFYATWCGPCVSEFPDIVATARMYRSRGLQLTTVSSNEPAERADVLKFLQKMHASSTTNLLFATTDTYALQAAFDPNMGAGVPFTVLIAPNGDILYQEVGALDMMKLRRTILANLPEAKDHEGSNAYFAK